MELINAEQIRSHLDWRETIDALERMFAAPCTAPPRHHHTIALDGREDATLLLMPAWAADRYVGVKVANVYPDNPSRGLPAIHGSYLLMNGTTGEPLALLDGGELTDMRTACASALAARYLSRAESRKLLIVGSGRLSRSIGLAHRAVRPIESIAVWGRNREHAEAVARSYRQAGLVAAAAADLESASGDADIISCVTMSTQPLVLGRWLKPGAHLDLVGGFRPHMREVDSDAVARSTIFADTREGVLGEAGDLLIPISEGRIDVASIAAELRDLASSGHPGRTGTSEITLFKSVGTAIEDLAAAILCYERCIDSP